MKPLRISTPEEHRIMLTQSDALLEPNVYQEGILDHIARGGSPLEAVNLLSESYVGLPSMINVTANAAKSIGLDSNNIMNNVLRNQFKQRFDADRCDNALKADHNEAAISWLAKIIHDPDWRQTIYDLFVQYPECNFLNLAVLNIVEAGYEKEVSKLRTSATSLKVFDTMLTNILDELIGADDTEFDEIAPRLVKMCCARQELYMYTQTLLKRLEIEFGNHSFTRVSNLLEKAATERGHKRFVDSLKSLQEPFKIAKDISAILSSQRITEADISMLKEQYSSANPPPVKYLCNLDLINRFLRMLYVPQNGSVAKNDMANNVIYLLTYATTINDDCSFALQRRKFDEVQDALKRLYVVLSIRTPIGSVSGTLKHVTEAIKQPVSAMGVLFWIEYMALETSYFETYFRTIEKPTLLVILDAISSLHKLQHPVVFEIIKKCIKHKYTSFVPETQIALQRSWVDCLLYLVELDYVLPVLNYIANEGAGLDASVTNRFMKKLLALAKPPYSIDFIQHVTIIVENLGKNLSPDLQKALKEVFSNKNKK